MERQKEIKALMQQAQPDIERATELAGESNMQVKEVSKKDLTQLRKLRQKAIETEAKGSD